MKYVHLSQKGLKTPKVRGAACSFQTQDSSQNGSLCSLSRC
jgi:hypothetical protein